MANKPQKAGKKSKLKKEWTRQELVLIGARFRANFVKAQAAHTLSVLGADPDALGIVPAATVADLKAALAKLEMAITDRDLMGVEAKEKTLEQGAALEDAKLWRRILWLRARSALVAGVDIPEGLGHMEARGADFKALARDINRMAGLARDHLPKLAHLAITEEMLEAGEKAANVLESADLEQDLARLNKLPTKVKDMYEQKARAYLLVKQVNYLAQSVHAEDGEAGAYNLDLLYRASRRQGATVQGTGSTQ